MNQRSIMAVFVAVTLIAANYVLRRYLEHAPVYLWWSFADVIYPGAIEKLVRTAPWRLLFPIASMDGSWSAMTIVLSHLVEKATSIATAWYLFNAILIAMSFVLGWWSTQSRVFGLTLALLMGFGTQLYHTYSVTGTVGFPLSFVYYQLVLAFGLKIVTATRPVASRLLIGFGFALACAVLSYEGWLDFLVFSWLAAAYLILLFRHHGRVRDARMVANVAIVMTIVGVLYVFVKIKFGYAQGSGSESDVVFNYPTLTPVIEDLVSNAITHLYIALTMFLPPVFLSSTALVTLGGDRLIELQHGYHPPVSYLVPMQYLFFWRYFAGAALVVFVYALVKMVRRSWATGARDDIAITVFLIMISVGGPTHSFIKSRPMNSVPIIGYHVMVSVLGVAALSAYLTMMIWRDVRNRRRAAIAVMSIWAIVLYSALSRPARLSALAAQVGLGQGLYPDPLRSIEQRIGIPITRAPGEEQFLLGRKMASGYGHQEIEAHPPDWFVALASPLPDPGQWQTTNGSLMKLSDGSWRLHGDGLQGRLQLLSPMLAIPARTRVIVRLNVVREQGRTCLGVIDRTLSKWVFTPEDLRQEYRFDSGDGRDLRIALGNCDPRLTENADTIFRISGGSMEFSR